VQLVRPHLAEMAELPGELVTLLLEEGGDYIASQLGETAKDNSILYQAFHFLITKGVEFLLPTVISASVGSPTGFTLGLIRRDLHNIQKDLDHFREIPFETIRHLVEDAKDDCEDEVNHADAFEKFKAIEKKSIKAVFSSKNFEHKIQAAQIAMLAKSYIKRYDAERCVFMALHEVEVGRRRALARQMQRLLDSFIAMPDYVEAVEKAKGAWYRTERATREHHEAVDRVDGMKMTIYANAVLCLNTVQPARLARTAAGEPKLVKTWTLRHSWIPEGERFALEISLTKEEIQSFIAEENEYEESDENEDVSDGQEEDEQEEENEEGEVEEDDDKSESDGYSYYESEDEQLSDIEDEMEEDEEEDDETKTQLENEDCSAELLGFNDSPFRIFTNLSGTVFIKSGMDCELVVNGVRWSESEEVEESEAVQNTWRMDNPPEHLKLEFRCSQAGISSRSSITTRKLNLTESAGQELVSLLQAGEESKSGVRAEQFLRTGTVTSVSWLVHWSEVLRCLHSGRDLQSPLFQPLPIDDTQPYLRAIICGGQRKVGCKKVGWRGQQAALVVGLLVWSEGETQARILGRLKTLKNNVKDMQVKEIDWESFQSSEFIRVELFLFSPLSCLQLS